VYGNPMHLPSDFPITKESCGFLSTSIALNLAIGHHVCGVRSSTNADRKMQHLHAAGRLYEYTIRLESTRGREYQEHHMNATLFVCPFALMVILNNLGHVHGMLHNVELQRLFYTRLESACMYFLVKRGLTSNNDYDEPQQDGGGCSNITTYDLQIFMHNVSIGLERSKSCNAAPAA
jgi:hypothetical protein